MKRILIPILVFIVVAGLYSQDIGNLTLRRNYFYNYEVFYVSDFDFENGQNNPDIFSYTLANNGSFPVRIKIEFEMIASVPGLGLDNERIFYVLTTPFTFKAKSSITISTKDIDVNMDRIYYDDGTPLTGLGVEESDYISEEKFTSIQQVILSSGRLPAGTYSFYFSILNEEGTLLLSDNEIIGITNPTTLELIAPGGMPEDNLEIETINPIFQWESPAFMWNEDLFPECGYWIRVAEYNPSVHSSLEEALNDNASLPFPDNGGYYRIPPQLVSRVGATSLYTAPTTFQYPLVGAKPLERGKSYVWQVKKIFPTTSGPETVNSNIFVFKIKAAEAESSQNRLYLQLIEQLIGTELFEQMFSGELNGFNPTGVIILNDTEQLTQDQFTELVNQFLQGELEVQSIRVE